MSNPWDIANLASPALDGIVRALSERPDQTAAETTAKAAATTDLILSFQPRDAIELLLSGQVVLFNELLADGARDAFREDVDTAKPRQHSILVSMGRVMQGHLDRLERRGNQPYRATVAADKDDCPAPVDPMVATNAPPESDPAAMPISAAPEAIEAAGGMPAGEPAVTTSWLDEPYEQWLIQTPSDLAATSAAIALLQRSRVMASDEPSNGRAEPSNVVEPALARGPSDFRSTRSLVETAAD